ncbi:VOC family protein [Chloroflexota bacterium]
MEKSWKLHHVGVIVRDMDKAVEYYQFLGAAIIGQESLDTSTYTDLTAYGKPADPKSKLEIKMVQLGSVTLELLQPVEGDFTQKEFLDSMGEGIQHIAFKVDDFDKERDKLVAKGLPVIHGGKEIKTGEWFAYFDTRKVGNVIIELIQASVKE